MIGRFTAFFTKKRVAALALAAALVAAGVGWKLGSGEAVGRYLTAPVTQQTIEENVTALGTLQPLNYVDVGTQVTGQLKKLHVNVGSEVKKGDLLAEIDPTLLETRVNSTRAAIKAQRAQLAERKAGLELASAQQKRAKTLFDAQATSADALEQAVAAHKTAAAQVDALQAQIEQSESTLKADEANLRYTKIFAPMSGTIVTLTAREGQTLVSSQQAPVILRIADLKTMTVQTQVSEADVPKVKTGMPVYFTTLGQPNRRWQGTARQVLPTPEVVNNVVLYNVLFDVENSDNALKPQMSAQTYFVIARAEDALAVPVAALKPVAAGTGKGRARKDEGGRMKDEGGPSKDEGRRKEEGQATRAEGSSVISEARAAERPRGERRARTEDGRPRERAYLVQVVKEDGKLEERRITVGVMKRINAQVLSGLAEGEMVVVGTREAEKAAPRAGNAKGGAMRGRL
jgi:macrolide-specific efflux system membrane fusion protein